MPYIQAVPALKDNYIWLIHSINSNDVLIVDPGDAEPVIKAITKKHRSPIAILNTHHHYDHVDGITQLVDKYDIPVYGSDTVYIPKQSISFSGACKITLHPNFPEFKILDIPGHTANHIAYLVNDMLFCGDTLFAAGCGRLLGGTATQLFDSLKKISKLPNSTRIFCGHEYTQNNLKFALTVEPNNEEIKKRINKIKFLQRAGKPISPTTISLELATNPFLRCDRNEVIRAAQRFAGAKLDNPLAVFTSLRVWKDLF
ncbi:MAG: hydroxyacylglutathione hydrolase [Piscirickettsiaceae bacterium]|nr:hydroxyacylglutathione hydrolase [Piscirickettsiaceae bacterium]